ncbi:MAG: DEAD/DEAH box helicase, partial [Brooklawnia sp.]
MHDAPDVLAGFSEPTRVWFNSAFPGGPTAAQTAAWQTLRSGQHALVVAPTGSGKTLAAFLHSLDELAANPSSGKVRVLYISPLKALAVDVERNLRVPLRGMQEAARAL